MGYTTEFDGTFKLNKKLTPELHAFLKQLEDTRRMKRDVDESIYGVEGEFFVAGEGFRGQGHSDNVIDHNEPPATQPGLWLGWTPTDDKMGLEWNGVEKFYNYGEWLVYLIEKILRPNGYVLNGSVRYSGEEIGDAGRLVVADNEVSINPYEGDPIELAATVQKLDTSTWKYETHSMQTEITYPLGDVPVDETPEVEMDANSKFLQEMVDLIEGGLEDEAVAQMKKEIEIRLAQLK